MRRLNSDDRIAWILLCKKRAKKSEKSRLILKKEKQRRIRKKLKDARTSKAYITLHAPVWFELIHSKNHKKLLEFIDALRNRVLIQKKSVKIDFANTKRMVVCGTLLFFSELCRIKRELGSLDLVFCTLPSDETVAQVLEHLGILKMLNCNHPVTPERADALTS